MAEGATKTHRETETEREREREVGWGRYIQHRRTAKRKDTEDEVYTSNTNEEHIKT